MAFKFRVCDVGEISDNDVGIRECGFYINFLVIPRNRINGIEIRYDFDYHGMILPTDSSV